MHSTSRHRCLVAIGIAVVVGWPGKFSSGQDFRPLSSSKLKASIRKLKELDQPIPEPAAGEWLSQHEEPGQRFAVYPRQKPNVLTEERHTLYIQPIGTFSELEQQLLESTREYLAAYFQCQVKTRQPIANDQIPASARRVHPEWGDPQILTSHVLERVLAPQLPADAFAMIAFTKEDLWPGEGWNFVFGYAAYRDRVGVWSMYRLGDPAGGDEAYRQCLQRMVKLATHETGHMFSMRHCTHARCNMQGSNGLEESDRQPLPLCSECQAKTAFATASDPLERAEALRKLCQRYGFLEAAKHYQEVVNRLQPGAR